MMIYEIWDFDEGNSPDRRQLANDLVSFANQYLEGKPFKITSEWIDVSQNSTMLYLDFFNGYDDKPKNNRIAQTKKETSDK